MEREQVIEGIRAAFAGVTLGQGVSLRQARSIDNDILGLDDTDWPGPDNRDDWTLVTEAEFLEDNIAHLDDAGLRYYLPAFLLWLLDSHDEVYPEDMARIGMIAAIAPSKEFRELTSSRRRRCSSSAPSATTGDGSYRRAEPRHGGHYSPPPGPDLGRSAHRATGWGW
jgi:hypothetical protein